MTEMKQMILSAALLAVAANVWGQQSDSLRMDSVVRSLPEVMVRGERPVVRVDGSRLVYDMPRLVEKRAVDDAYAALQLLPGVAETDGRLTLGSQPVTLVIDGKVSTLDAAQVAQLLRALPASRVDRAEVMYTAPARMQVRGAVINVVLRQAAAGEPLQGEANLAWNQKHEARFGERATLLYSNGPLSVDAMYKHSHGNVYTRTDETSHHTLADGSVHDMDTHQQMHGGGPTHDYRLGVDWRPAAGHLLSLVYTGQYGRDRTRQTISGNVEGHTRIDGHTWLHNLRTDYAAPFGLRLGADFTWYRNPETQTLASTLPTGSLRYVVDNSQRIFRSKFFLSQEHRLGRGWSLNYGAIYMGSSNRSRQLYAETEQTAGPRPASSETHQQEDDLNLYAGFSKTFAGHLSMEASAAASYYHSVAWHRWNLFPTLTLTWAPKAGNMVQLGLSCDRRYPDYWTLTNFTTYSNGGYNEVTGNPGLRPTSKYRLQLVGLLHGKYQLVAWFHHTDDYFTQTPYQRRDRLTVSYQYQNFDFQQQAGFQASAPVRPWRWLDVRATLIGVWMRDKNSAFYDIPFDRRMAYVMARLNNTVTLSTWPDITLSADGMIRSRAIQATYDLPGSGSVDLSMRWRWWNKRAVVRLFCTDLFETGGINPRIDYRGQQLRMAFARYREVGLSFTYRFGGYTEKKREEVDTSRFGQ